MTFRPLFRPAVNYFTSQISTRKSSNKGGSAQLSAASEGSHKRDYKDFHRYIDGVVASEDREDRDLEQQSVSKLVESSDPAGHSPRRNFLPFMGTKSNRGTSPPPFPPTVAPYNGTAHATNDPSAPNPIAQKSTGWRSNVGVAQAPVNPNDAIALASLDPRSRATNGRQEEHYPAGADEEGNYHSTFGTTTEAKAVPTSNEPPQAADSDRERGIYPIEVQREFRLERE